MDAVRGSILVLGLGRSGTAVARYLAGLRDAGEDVRVTVVDEAPESVVAGAAGQLRALGVEVVTGAESVPPGEFATVVASPGIAPHKPLMRSARGLGVPVISEIELAWRESVSPWMAVTGTNGKTTVTALVGHLLAEGGIPAEVVGNIGTAAISVAPLTGEATVLVAEVSSFQLALTDGFCPRVSVLLNITPDHLDWHGSMEAYAADKARVFANQGPDDTAVIDIDDEGSGPWADTVDVRGVRVCRVSRKGLPEGGAGLVDGALMLDTPGGPVAVLPARDLPIRGAHNVSNALAACAAAVAAGVPVGALAAGLRTFRPVAHRLEPAGVVDGVEYFDDSKATNADAVFKALSAFDERPLIVLLGGRSKEDDFSELASTVAARCKAAIVFGEAGDTIAAALAETSARVIRRPTMVEAIETARELAEAGDVVLLSPACKSFDEFNDYEHRGDVFHATVDRFAGRAPEDDR